MSGHFGWATNNGAPPPSTLYPPITPTELPQPYFPTAPPPGEGAVGQNYYQPIQATSVQNPENYIPPAYAWVPLTKAQNVPGNAVIGGSDIDGAAIYVGRAYHEGEEMPAKIIDERKEAYVAWGGDEHSVDEYKVLVENKLEWVKCQGGNVPMNAVKAGNTANGEPLYVGRAMIAGALSVGKVHTSHGCCYVPFDGKEHGITEYEVLVLL